jgi:hypothetical protein
VNKHLIATIFFLISGINNVITYAQTVSASNNLVAQPIPDRTVFFNIADPGVAKPITWGLDLAWLSEVNIRRGIAFMGSDRVDLVRSSFTPTSALVNGELQATELSRLNERLNIIKLLKPGIKVVLNCDHPNVDPWFSGNASRWAQLIDVTARLHQEKGLTVITVSPFNEPDNTVTGQGTLSDFYNIAGELRKNPRFDNIRISGGNTLNTDQALSWYNQLKDRLDEGNTHQLAGSFVNYANFFKTVKDNGDYATNDELHNVMEAMVGVEYGMQAGIWWGTAELARGEFVKASFGQRLGYAEHRNNWTAASVYRSPEGKIQAFCGESERQATTTTYRYVSKDRDVYYDGYGPQREFTLVMPGGTGYQVNQPTAEKVINITWGDDIQPIINGQYVLVNRMSNKVLEVANGSTANGAVIRQKSYTGANYQQWNITPLDARSGGDFSYFNFTAVHSAKVPDVLNFSLDNGASVQQYDNNKSTNQQWYAEYNGDGWFYIRNRHSNKCLQVTSIMDGALAQQSEKNGNTNQQWRFIPVGAAIEMVAPAAPANLVATPNASSVRLEWTANSEADLAGYTIFRADNAGGPYNTIARNVKTISFTDNTAIPGKTYYYAIKATDFSLNRSPYSNEAVASPTGVHDLVMSLPFNGNTMDTTVNLNHGAAYGTASYTTGKTGSGAILLNGSSSFVQLPSGIAGSNEISIATWVYWLGSSAGQRIFDFGNDENEYLYLTPKSSSGNLRFGIKNKDAEQGLNAPVLPSRTWTHVAVTIGSQGTTIYVDGKMVAESGSVTISPADFKPILNYIGRSRLSDPLFMGFIDDFRVYNYALLPDEVAKLASGTVDSNPEINIDSELTIWPVPANDVVHLRTSGSAANGNTSEIRIYNIEGKIILKKEINPVDDYVIDIKNWPAGIYIIKLNNSDRTFVKRFSIEH